MRRIASSRDFKKTCTHAYLGSLILDCKARIKDVEIEASITCSNGRVRIKTREFEVIAEEPGEAFYEPTLENPMPSTEIVPRIRKVMNRTRLRDRKKGMEKLARDILASLLKLCDLPYEGR